MKIILPLLFILAGFNCFSQNLVFHTSDYPKFLNSSGDTLLNAYVGGLESPQFSAIDLNKDGKKDLFVFDRSDGKEDIFTGGYGGIMVYKNTTTSSSPLSFSIITTLLLDKDGLNIYTSNVAIPAISDIDKDGDIDILAFGILGGYVEFSRNEA